MLLGFIPFQIGVLAFLITLAGIGAGIAVLVAGVLFGVIVMRLLMLRGRRQLDRYAPADRLFGAVATVWASGMSRHRLAALQEAPPTRSADWPVDGVCWVDRSGVHWRPGKPSAPLRAFDARGDEIQVARMVSLGWRNVGLELALKDGDEAALKVSDRGTLRAALTAIGVRVEAVG